MKNKFINFWKLFFAKGAYFIFVFIALDQFTKLLLEHILRQKEDWTIVVIKNFFNLSLSYNKGAAWSSFQGKLLMLSIISFVAGGAMIYYLIKNFKKSNTFTKYCLYLMIGGCYGNFIDRAFFSSRGVIDFLDFVFGTYHFPTFNVADSCLVVGIILLIIASLFNEYKEDKKKKQIEASKGNMSSKDDSNE